MNFFYVEDCWYDLLIYRWWWGGKTNSCHNKSDLEISLFRGQLRVCKSNHKVRIMRVHFRRMNEFDNWVWSLHRGYWWAYFGPLFNASVFERTCTWIFCSAMAIRQTFSTKISRASPHKNIGSSTSVTGFGFTRKRALKNVLCSCFHKKESNNVNKKVLQLSNLKENRSSIIST